jgi:uncharacterized membrane protein
VVEHPLIERYMARFDTCLDELECPDRREIVDEIRNHIAESRGAGKPLDTILEVLGPADELARAYAAELLLNPRPDRRITTIRRAAALTAFVAATGIATVIVVGALGSVGIGFTISGVAMLLIGILEASDTHLPGVEMNGISPIWDIVLGPVVVAIGLASVALVRVYLRFILRTFRRVLPRVRTLSQAMPRNT